MSGVDGRCLAKLRRCRSFRLLHSRPVRLIQRSRPSRLRRPSRLSPCRRCRNSCRSRSPPRGRRTLGSLNRAASGGAGMAQTHCSIVEFTNIQCWLGFTAAAGVRCRSTDCDSRTSACASAPHAGATWLPSPLEPPVLPVQCPSTTEPDTSPQPPPPSASSPSAPELPKSPSQCLGCRGPVGRNHIGRWCRTEGPTPLLRLGRLMDRSCCALLTILGAVTVDRAEARPAVTTARDLRPIATGQVSAQSSGARVHAIGAGAFAVTLNVADVLGP